MPSHVLMPLRSNAAWFNDQEAQTRLERQVKINLMLYDRVIFQNGRWRMTAGFDHQGMEICNFELDDEERKRISYCTQGAPFGVAANGIVVMQSQAEVAYDVDFLPLIQKAGLEGTAAFDWLDGDLAFNDDGKRLIADAADALIRLHEAILPQNRYVRKCLVNGLLRDAALASYLQLPLSIDFHVSAFVAEQQRMALKHLNLVPEPTQLFFDHWLRLKLPNFGAWEWENILDARESAAGLAFRAMITRVCQQAKESMANGADDTSLKDLIQLGWQKELIEEIRSSRPTHGSTAVNLLLNVVPFGSIVSGTRDLISLGKACESWFSIVCMK